MNPISKPRLVLEPIPVHKFVPRSKVLLVGFTITACAVLSACSGKEGMSSYDLSHPSADYLIKQNDDRVGLEDMTEDQWLSLAKERYRAKDYARALRAAEYALELDDSKEAKQIAMLSAINISHNNIKAYNHNEFMTDSNQEVFKQHLTNITTNIGDTKANIAK